MRALAKFLFALAAFLTLILAGFVATAIWLQHGQLSDRLWGESGLLLVIIWAVGSAGGFAWIADDA